MKHNEQQNFIRKRNLSNFQLILFSWITALSLVSCSKKEAVTIPSAEIKSIIRVEKQSSVVDLGCPDIYASINLDSASNMSVLQQRMFWTIARIAEESIEDRIWLNVFKFSSTTPNIDLPYYPPYIGDQSDPNQAGGLLTGRIALLDVYMFRNVYNYSSPIIFCELWEVKKYLDELEQSQNENNGSLYFAIIKTSCCYELLVLSAAPVEERILDAEDPNPPPPPPLMTYDPFPWDKPVDSTLWLPPQYRSIDPRRPGWRQ